MDHPARDHAVSKSQINPSLLLELRVGLWANLILDAGDTRAWHCLEGSHKTASRSNRLQKRHKSRRLHLLAWSRAGTEKYFSTVAIGSGALLLLHQQAETLRGLRRRTSCRLLFFFPVSYSVFLSFLASRRKLQHGTHPARRRRSALPSRGRVSEQYVLPSASHSCGTCLVERTQAPPYCAAVTGPARGLA